MTDLLSSFFSPRRIALIGASERGIYPAGILKNLLEQGYRGRVHPVNPQREQVFGLPCVPAVGDLDERPDLALLTVPRQAVIPVMQDCIQIGIPAAVVISAGFAEADQEGKDLQKQLAALVQAHPIRLVGPNCAGLASLPTGLVATRLFGELMPGPVAFVSQSGALMMSLQGVFADRRIGMSRMISLGNQADVSLAEMLRALADDPQTGVITVFMEGIQQGKTLVKGFKTALTAGKPVILLKTGRTQRGMAAAATHTAALAGEDRVFQAICDQYGVILVDDINPMMDCAQLAAAFGGRIQPQMKIGFISQSGGMGSLTADWIDYTGLSAPPLSKNLENRLYQQGTLPDYAVLLNPADVRGASVRREAAGSTLQAFLDDPDFDMVVMLFARSMMTQESAETARAVIATAQESEKPLAVVWSGQRITANPPTFETAPTLFRRAGIPLFSQSSDLLQALSRLQSFQAYRQRWLAGFKERDA